MTVQLLKKKQMDQELMENYKSNLKDLLIENIIRNKKGIEFLTDIMKNIQHDIDVDTRTLKDYLGFNINIDDEIKGVLEHEKKRIFDDVEFIKYTANYCYYQDKRIAECDKPSFW